MNNHINIILKDTKEVLYRIVKIGHEKDKYGNDYFKVMMPDLIGKKIHTKKTHQYVRPPDISAFIQSISEFNMEEFHEFTYHYTKGVAHFKNNRGKHIHQMKNLPKLQDKKFLNFIRFIIHDLKKFKIYKKSLTNNDLVLNLPLNNLGRLLNLYLLEDINIKIENNDKRVILIKDYKINISGTKKYLIIQEFCYSQPELKENNIDFILFVFDDTTIKVDKLD